MKDPIVQEVRRFRHAHEKRHGKNIDAIFKDICKHQVLCGHPLVRLKPNKINNEIPWGAAPEDRGLLKAMRKGRTGRLISRATIMRTLGK